MAKNEMEQAYFKMLAGIKKYYLSNLDKIIAHHNDANNKLRLFNAYAFDWKYVLNDVEFIAWRLTREKGNLPFYPQFPVLNYYLDFGNPQLKLGVEVDGIDFHDREKDKERDKKLKTVGWRIIRISASQLVKTNYSDSWGDLTYFNEAYDTLPDEITRSIEDWIMDTGDGILEAIKVIYFDGPVYGPKNYNNWFTELCRRSLNKHTLIGWQDL